MCSYPNQFKSPPGDVPGQIYDRTLGEVYPFGLSADCIDSDGDGWGFNDYLEKSCVVGQITKSDCVYIDADIHDGWGWNATTGQSCAPLENVINSQPTTQCIDTEGDGYGWDGTRTCTIGTVTTVASTGPDTNCVYTDAGLHDGWGWNATTGQSCAPLENEINSQPTAQCIDTDGDGWGWNGTVSCTP